MDVWNINVFVIFVLVKLSAVFGMNCTFDNDWCEWMQNSGNWTRSKNATSIVNVKPIGDHTTGRGYYIYADASNAPNGGIVRHTSPNVTRGDYCLSLWYFMVGKNVTSLKIVMKTNKDTVKFAKYGKQGPNWKEAKFGMSPKKPFQIVIEAEFSTKIQENSIGYIGIDDVVISPGLCSIDCTFNDGFCAWTFTSGNFTWSRSRYRDLFLNLTYLSSDHDYYLNIYKKNGINSTGTAKLFSPWQQPGQMCLTFQTFLFGSTSNVLNVYIMRENIKGQQLMLSVNNVSHTTLHKQYIEINETIQVTYRIKFVGKVARGKNGNILIDNIASIDAQCTYGCESSPCENSATCMDGVSGNFTCVCSDDWSGRTCNESATKVLRSGCESSPCINNAMCLNGVSGNYTCVCVDDWSGRTCNESETTELRSERTQIPIVFVVAPVSTAFVIIIAGVLVFMWRRRVRERKDSEKKKENEVFEAEGEIITGVDNNGYALAELSAGEKQQRDQADTSVAIAHNEPDTYYTCCGINEQVPERTAVHSVNHGLIQDNTYDAAAQAKSRMTSNDESTLYANTVLEKVAVEMNEESSYDTLGTAELKNIGHGVVKEWEDRDYDTFETVKYKTAGNSTMQDKQVPDNDYDHIGHNTERTGEDYSHVTLNL